MNEMNCCMAVRWEDVELCINQREWLPGSWAVRTMRANSGMCAGGCWYGGVNVMLGRVRAAELGS